jgi:adenylate kinase
MLNIVIFGAPGSGKGTQSTKISEKYALEHISTGDMLRAEIKANTEFGKKANSYISKGHLIPDEVMIDKLDACIERLEKKASEVADDAKEEFSDQLEKLKELRDSLSSKLEEYEKIAEPKWEVIRDSAGKFFEAVSIAWKENFANVSEAFRKDRNNT